MAAEGSEKKKPRRKRPEAVIRPLEPRDREAVRDICCRTAFRNQGSDVYFEDREVHADYWTSYYTDYNPSDSMVAEIDGKVVGYFLGCSDHRDFERKMGLRIVPKAILRAIWRSLTGRYKRRETKKYLWHMIFRAPFEAPRIDHHAYPSHYHCNILRQGYGQGLYTRMVLMFLDRLEEKGVTRIHGHITEPAESGTWEKFYQGFGPEHFEVMSEKPTTMLWHVAGDAQPMVNRAWGTSIEHYRHAAHWLHDKTRI